MTPYFNTLLKEFNRFSYSKLSNLYAFYAILLTLNQQYLTGH